MRFCCIFPTRFFLLLSSYFILNTSNPNLSTNYNKVISMPGEFVSLECEIPNYKTDSVIRWLLNDEPILLPDETSKDLKNIVDKSRRRPFFNSTYGIHMLHIAHVLIEDDGVWHCQEIPKNQELFTFTSQPIRLIVAVVPQAPYILFEDKRLVDGTIFTVREKNIVTFSCFLRNANPAPTRIEWLLSNGLNLTASSQLQEEYLEDERLYHSKSDLTFEVNRTFHRVILHCHVHHITFLKNIAVSLTFNILYTPSFIISRSPGFGYPIKEGMAVSLKCEIDANPSSIPQWVKDDGPLSTKVESSGGYLNFSSITKEHAGWYRCSTYHEFGHFASFGYFLSIRYSCRTMSLMPFHDFGTGLSTPCYIQSKPFVEPLNRTLIAIAGKSISIIVQYCANPIPSRAYWIVQSFVLKPGETNGRFSARNITKYVGLTDCYKTVLDIFEVNEEDSGEFVFLVKNSYGIDEGVVWLNITQSSFSVSLGWSIFHSLTLHINYVLIFWICNIYFML